MLAIIKYK